MNIIYRGEKMSETYIVKAGNTIFMGNNEPILTF